jgi:CSLREA domain-containing protein
MLKKLSNVIMLSLLISLVGSIGSIPAVRASTTIPVTTDTDMVADDGRCSLREAIEAANTDTASGLSAVERPVGSGNDTITVPDGCLLEKLQMKRLQ